MLSGQRGDVASMRPPSSSPPSTDHTVTTQYFKGTCHIVTRASHDSDVSLVPDFLTKFTLSKIHSDKCEIYTAVHCNVMFTELLYFSVESQNVHSHTCTANISI